VGDDNDDLGPRRTTKPGEISWNQGLLLAGLAMTIPGLLFAPPAFGYWLDSVFGTAPWLALAGFVVGLIGTAIDIWQILKRVGLLS
jgi:hypothetical protein